ncbi:MAG: SPASM domain-containing protein [Magnetococcales bacterium]|nr:SPASM domain-containing protein [Magnetococcales bacterium]
MPSWLLGFLQKKFLYQPVIEKKGISVADPPLFDTVFFEVRTRCNGECAFCLAAVATDPRPDQSMSLALYEKILNDLCAIGFTGRLAFHNNSDPLIFKHLTEFVALARRRLPQCRIQILTNGKALNVRRADGLIKAGINELLVNFYHDDPQAAFPAAFQEIAQTVLPRYYPPEALHIQGVGEEHRGDNPQFHYQVTRRAVTAVLSSRAGNAPNKSAPSPQPRGFCQYPWTQFIVTADGRVALCCNDVLFVEKIGSVQDNTVLEVWRGEGFRSYRERLINGERHAMPNTCGQCDFYGIKKPGKGWLARWIYEKTL